MHALDQKTLDFQKEKGFTLIELVVTLTLIGILAAFALPRFATLTDDSTLAVLENFEGLVKTSAAIVNQEIRVRPQNRSNNNSRYNFDNGDQIRIRANYPDGRWNNTFAVLLDLNGIDVAQVNNNNCNNNDFCVRQRGGGWFQTRGYAPTSLGRGFVIFPRGYNVNNNTCYVYYLTPNANANPATPLLPITGSDFAGC